MNQIYTTNSNNLLPMHIGVGTSEQPWHTSPSRNCIILWWIFILFAYTILFYTLYAMAYSKLYNQ